MAQLDSQHLVLVIEAPTVTNIRVSQDIALIITAPSVTNIRISQNIELLLVSNITGRQKYQFFGVT